MEDGRLMDDSRRVSRQRGAQLHDYMVDVFEHKDAVYVDAVKQWSGQQSGPNL